MSIHTSETGSASQADPGCTVGERGVVFFRNQNNVDNKLQKEICKRLNDLSGAPKENTFYRHSLLAMQGEDPEMGKVDQDRIQKMYSPPVEGMPRQSHTKDWHTDSSFEPMPPSYTVLRMTDLPAAGGGKMPISIPNPARLLLPTPNLTSSS